MVSYGFAGHVGFAKESSGGTPVAATNYIEALSEGFSSALDRFDVKNITGKFSEPDDMTGIERITGDLSFSAIPDDLGWFLMGTMGIQSNAEVLSGFLHTHNFTMRTSDFDTVYATDPFTFEIFRDVTSSQQYAGVLINTLEFNVAVNQAMQITAGMIGTSQLNLAKTTPSFTSSSSDPFAFDTGSVSIGGTATGLVEALTVSIDNQMEGIAAINNTSVIRAIRRTGPQLIRLSGSIAFENITEYEAFRAGTEQQFVFNFTRADSFAMTIDMPRVTYTAFPLAMGGRDRQVVAFEARAPFSTTSNQAIQINLTNTVSGY